MPFLKIVEDRILPPYCTSMANSLTGVMATLAFQKKLASASCLPAGLALDCSMAPAYNSGLIFVTEKEVAFFIFL